VAHEEEDAQGWHGVGHFSRTWKGLGSHGRKLKTQQRTGLNGDKLLPDVQRCTGGTKSKSKYYKDHYNDASQTNPR